MVNIFLFIALLYLFTFAIGELLERIKIPWIFAALLLGILVAINKPFESIISSQIFEHFATTGMYLLLFLIGFELNLESIRKTSRFIFKATFVIILFEALFGTLLIHYVFRYDWFVSFVVSLSFATVGEAVIFPILDEFRMVNTKLGQSIISIGILDDIIEVLALIFTVALVCVCLDAVYDLGITVLSLLVLILLTFRLLRLRRIQEKLASLRGEILFLLTLTILFLFVGVGERGHAEPLSALIAGIGVKAFVPAIRLHGLESRIRAVCYGLFGPVFFFWVGVSIDISYIVSYPLLVLLIVAVSKGAKLLGSMLVGRKELGVKRSIVMGVGLSIRFSTSIVIIKILFENEIIGGELYSAIIASTMAFKFIVPLLFARLLLKWNIDD